MYGVPSAAVPSLQKAIVSGTSVDEFGGNATETYDDHVDRMPLVHTQSRGGRTSELGPEAPQVATKQAAQSLKLAVDTPGL